MLSKIFLLIASAASLCAAYSGDATFYNIEAGTTACGWRNRNNEYIVAMNAPQWNERASRWSNDGRTNTGNQCGRMINIRYKNRSKRAVVGDLCPECKHGDLDLTPGLFQDLIGDKNLGRVRVDWDWV
jgi:hypothetical protein